MQNISLLEPKASRRTIYLMETIKKAINWQKTVPSYTVTENGHDYVGPYKWIIAFVGTDSYKPFD